MYKLLLDSDALIKLTHSEVIFKLCDAFDCLITKEIEEETVTEGRKRFYSDALAIEKLLQKKLLKVKESKRKKEINEDLGNGEKSILQLYYATRNCTIISDDSAFIKYLEKENIRFFVPSDLIILLKKLNKITQKDALHFLDKMQIFIKEDVYNEAKTELKEELKNGNSLPHEN